MKKMFYCDPWENEDCKKTGCFLRGGDCMATTNEKYAFTNDYGKPIEVTGKGSDDDEQD